MPEQKLRIITWNCHHGTAEERYALLEKYKPDIAIIQEVRTPKRKEDEHFVWIRSRQTENKCVAVFCSEELKISFTPVPTELPEIFMPIKVVGRFAFNLLAVWTLDDKNYTGSFEPILSACRKFLSYPTIIAGDFNSTPKVRGKNKKFNHHWLVETLERDFNLVSAYHTPTTIQPGHESESESTFFLHGHRDKPFHIDYCFVPKSWTIKCTKIGSYDKWCNKEKQGEDKISDHCPLIVDLLIDDTKPKTDTIIRRPGQDRFCVDIERQLCSD